MALDSSLPADRKATTTEFNPELDGVRGLFMVAVFLFHCVPKTGNVWIDGLFGSMWPAIDVFFALSGFLITRNLLDDIDNRYRFLNFFVNRALRIIPAFTFAVFLVFVVLRFNPVMVRALEDVPSVWWFLTYSFNIKIAIDNGWPDNHLMNHFWSLCVEEQFYFLWPFVIFLFRGRGLAFVIAGFFLLALFSELWFLSKDAHWAVIHSNLLTRFDSLGVGSLLALLHRSSRKLAYINYFSLFFYLSSAVLLFCAVYAKGLRFTGWHAHLIVQPMLMVWSSCLVYLLVNARNRHPWLRAIFGHRISTFLGKYSYGMYIYHWLIFMVVVHENAFGLRTGYEWLDFLMVAVLSLIASMLSFHGLEKWFLRLKLRRYVARAQTV